MVLTSQCHMDGDIWTDIQMHGPCTVKAKAIGAKSTTSYNKKAISNHIMY